jgi:dynein light chain 1, axonemal
MSGSTTVKEAIARFEEAEYRRRLAEVPESEQENVPRVVAAQESKVLLIGMLPPIVKMDKDITTLKECEHLGLSTNAIEKIGPGLKELKNLKVLSLGRNNIRKLEQLDLPQLEQLWVSYNKIDKLTGLDKLKNLRVLFMSNNLISSWTEIDRLANQCPELTDVLFLNNPLCNSAASNQEYRYMMLQRLPKVTRLDGVPVDPEEKEEAERRR